MKYTYIHSYIDEVSHVSRERCYADDIIIVCGTMPHQHSGTCVSSPRRFLMYYQAY